MKITRVTTESAKNGVNNNILTGRLISALSIYVLVIFIAGCFATKDEFYALQRQTAQIQTELKNNESVFTSEAGQLKTSTSRLDELHEKLRKSFADTNARIDEIEGALGKLKGDRENADRELGRTIQTTHEVIKVQGDAIKNLKSELIRIAEEILKLKQQSGAFANITSEINRIKTVQTLQIKEKKEIPPKEKKETYEAALAFYNKKEYSKSIDAFENFLLLFPNDPLSGNSLYWIGECYYTQKKFKEALSYFHRVITDFPNGNKVAPALLKEAYCLEELDMHKESKAALEELAVRFPYSDEAKQAGKRLKDGKKGKR